MKDKISILVSNYNNAKYLKRCINSCLVQSYKNKEIIIIDDFSTDNSLEVLKIYQKSKNVKLIYNKVRFSKFPAFNQLHALIKAFKDLIAVFASAIPVTLKSTVCPEISFNCFLRAAISFSLSGKLLAAI